MMENEPKGFGNISYLQSTYIYDYDLSKDIKRIA